MATVAAPTSSKPFFLQKQPGETEEITYTAAEFRSMLSALVPTPGVLAAGSFYVAQSNPIGWSLLVAGGSAMVGNYLVRSTETAVSLLTLNTNPGGTRTHKVWLAVYDKAIAGTEYAAKIVVTEDTNGSGAPAPVDAAASLQLATVTFAPGQSYVRQDDIYDRRTHASGGTGAYELNLAAGFSDASATAATSPVRVRVHNGQAVLSGAIGRSGGFPASGSPYLLGTLPTNFRPNRKRFLVGAAGSADVATESWRLTISSVGSMFANIAAGSTGPGLLFLDGIVFDLD